MSAHFSIRFCFGYEIRDMEDIRTSLITKCFTTNFTFEGLDPLVNDILMKISFGRCRERFSTVRTWIRSLFRIMWNTATCMENLNVLFISGAWCELTGAEWTCNHFRIGGWSSSGTFTCERRGGWEHSLTRAWLTGLAMFRRRSNVLTHFDLRKWRINWMCSDVCWLKGDSSSSKITKTGA